ncbi:hypothetical protein BS47DRAFT_577554 [Hydnum rufescens UP504]|uniref:Uncharacterized protein n=1 Tax=Hydnum rufescens UP504 TaxID=1448309 RepID=A0A9P6DNE5_9AGAM|nr:hypothetical protein BS47DRAFT_577554 [Hydnum rufescens UP504]
MVMPTPLLTLHDSYCPALSSYRLLICLWKLQTSSNLRLFDLTSPGLSCQDSRILALLSEGPNDPPRSTPKTFPIRFLRSPQSCLRVVPSCMISIRRTTCMGNHYKCNSD